MAGARTPAAGISPAASATSGGTAVASALPLQVRGDSPFAVLADEHAELLARCVRISGLDTPGLVAHTVESLVGLCPDQRPTWAHVIDGPDSTTVVRRKLPTPVEMWALNRALEIALRARLLALQWGAWPSSHPRRHTAADQFSGRRVAGGLEERVVAAVTGTHHVRRSANRAMIDEGSELRIVSIRAGAARSLGDLWFEVKKRTSTFWVPANIKSVAEICKPTDLTSLRRATTTMVTGDDTSTVADAAAAVGALDAAGQRAQILPAYLVIGVCSTPQRWVDDVVCCDVISAAPGAYHRKNGHAGSSARRTQITIGDVWAAELTSMRPPSIADAHRAHLDWATATTWFEAHRLLVEMDRARASAGLMSLTALDDSPGVSPEAAAVAAVDRHRFAAAGIGFSAAS